MTIECSSLHVVTVVSWLHIDSASLDDVWEVFFTLTNDAFWHTTQNTTLTPLILSDSRTAHILSFIKQSFLCGVQYYSNSLATDGKAWTLGVLFLCQNLWCWQNSHHWLICSVNRPTKLCHLGKAVVKINRSEHILYRLILRKRRKCLLKTDRRKEIREEG